ncbi:hypothetical protein Q604_UNBC01041G0001, partial [human gut metagenome]
RLIPAHAGSTVGRRNVSCRRPAHPRSRGVDSTSTMEGAWGNGSSPLTRGRPNETNRITIKWRLIPAHAGSTFSKVASGASSAAHPRSRGVDTSTAWGQIAAAGSSPL